MAPALSLAVLAGGSDAQAQVTNTVGSLTLSSATTLSIAAGNVTLSTGTLSMNANGSSNPSACVTGPGTLQLAATTNNGTTYPDIYFNASDTANSTANWGTAINAPVNLGALQRFIWGKTDHAGVGQYGLTQADCQLNGAISGSGGLTFIAQDAYTGSNPMETPFCLNAANTFTGMVQIQRGSVYVGNASGFPAGDVLQFNVAAGNNGKFFLWGNNVTVANLSSTGAGNAVIAAGNRNPSAIAAATLTIQENLPTTYAGTLINSNIEYSVTTGSAATTLSVVKTGPATLTLAGTNKFTGSLTVNAGKLYLNNVAGSVVGPVLVTNGATLGGSSLVATNVTLANGSALEAGGGAGSGTLTMKSLVLGAVATDALTLNLSSTAAGLATAFAVTNLNGLTNNGVTTINVTGTLPLANPATYTLLTYSGASKGSGTFALGSLPAYQNTAYITNNTTASALQLVVPLYVAPALTWLGSPTNNWDLTGTNDWLLTSPVVPAVYADGDTVIFDDTATNFTVNLAATVQPYNVVFSNSVNAYTLGGAGGISNTASLTVQGGGNVTLATVNAYKGNTTVGAGTLVLGANGAIPSGPTAGNVVVNGTLDLAGYSPVLNNLAGMGTVDDLAAGGSLMLTVTNPANSTFVGTLQNSSGAIALTKTGAGALALGANNPYSGGTTIAGGALSITGAGGLGTGPVNVTANLAGGTASFLTVSNGGPVTLANNLTLPNASGTYILTKNATGPLTFTGALNGGGAGTILRTTTDTAGDVSTVFEFAGPVNYAGNLQLYRGVVQVDNPGALGTGTIYGDANASTLGDLNFTNSMTFANALVLQSATTLSPNNNNVLLTGAISGSGALIKYGNGSLTLGGPLSYVGTTTAAAGTLNLLGTLNTWQNQPLNIASGAVVNAAGLLNLNVNENGSKTGIEIYGPGQLDLTSTNSSAANPDMYFGPDHSGTAYWGAAVTAPINLGPAQRFIYAKTGHNGVGQYTFTNADAQFRGSISGSGGLTFIAQMTWTASTPYMEVPFVLMGSNSFSGPLEIQRGSVYLGNVNALTQTNSLFLNPATGNNARFFLYGTNATVGSLSSATTGASEIVNGNEKTGASLTLPAATLSVWQTTDGTYAGSLQDTQPEYDGSGSGTTGPLNLAKYGPATLTLSGSNSFTGTLSVNQGAVLVNGPSTGGGAATVAGGAILGGNGTLNSSVTVASGGTLAAGNASGFGTFTINSLTLGAGPGDTLGMNFTANPSGVVGNLNVNNLDGLVNNGTVTVNVGGITPSAPGAYPLVAYAGSLQGTGSFVTGTLPALCTAYVTNNVSASAIQLIVTSVNLPVITWVGSPQNNWDLLGDNDWEVTSNGVATSFQDGDLVNFDDSATNFLVNLTTNVAPGGVVLTNNQSNYLIMGNGRLTGYTSLAKVGTGGLTLAVTNTYSGNTAITAGTLVLGAPGAIPGGPGFGNVSVDGTLDLAGFSPQLNNLTGGGTVDNVSAGGQPVLTVTGSGTATFAGVMQNTSGSLQLTKTGNGTLILAGPNTYTGGTLISSGTLQVGAGGTSGTAGASPIVNNGVLAFNRSDSNNVLNDITGNGSLAQNGPGLTTLSGNLTYVGPTFVNAGVLAFPKDITFDAAAGTTLNIAAGARVKMSATVFSLNVNASALATDVTGPGTLELTSKLNSIESFSDINFGPNVSGTTDYGGRLGCNLDLGSVHRTIYGWTSRNDVARFGLTGCDCQLAGSIVGTAELSFEGQNSLAGGVNVLEVPFALNGSNNFTGPLEIERGSVYLGNPNALVAGNPLILDPKLSQNSRLFLYGFNAAISDLQSAAYGTGLIANGNGATSTNVGPATLAIQQNNPFTFTGSIVDWYTEYAAPAAGALVPTLSLVKNGPAALTLTGVNTYSGTTLINAGELYINNASTGGGAVTVNATGILGGSGLVTGPVTVQNGGAIEAGPGSANGNLTLKSLTLGSLGADTSTMNLAATAVLQVTNNNGLTINSGPGSVTINVVGSLGATGSYPLILYKGILGGTGYAAFTLGTLPPGVIGVLANNAANHSVDLTVTAVTIPRWTGAFSSAWNTNTLAAPKNWVLNSDGVSSIDYVDGETVLFDDTATSPVASIDQANVAPFGVTVSNVVQNLTIAGPYGIGGKASLTKLGSGTLILSASDSYTGNTTITAGTLSLGSATALPAGPQAGRVILNGLLDLAGYSPAVNNLTGSGVVDNLAAGGAPVITVVCTGSNVFSGAFQNTTGSLAVNLTGGGTLTLSGTNGLTGAMVVSNGTLNVVGSIGTGGVNVTAGGTLRGAGVISGASTLADGSTLVLTVNNPLSVGPVLLNGKVSVSVAGNVSTTVPGTYLLLNHGTETGSGTYALVAIPGLSDAGLAARLNDTNNQLQLVIQPAALTHTIADVKHVVVFVQENRSFDSYFGSLHGVHGFGDRSVQMLSNSNSVLYQPSGSSYELPYHTTVQCINDLDHSWSVTHAAIDNDRNDAWIANKGAETMAYLNRTDLPYYYALADAYTILDDYHCSVRASTDPNRVSLMTGMIDPNSMGAGTINGVTYPGGPLIDNTEPANGWGPGWVTYPELLLKAGVSWKIYQQSDNYDDNALAWFAVYKQAAAGNPLHDQGNVFQANAVTAFQNDVASNTLPAVSWIIGPTGQSEHPPYSPASGEALTKQFLDALAANPHVFSNTVFILTYDENDGFWDQGLPITPPAGTPNEFVGGQAIGLGIRVPAIIVSPWTRGGHVCSQVFDHTSILRFLETWTGVREPNISNWRRQVTGDLTSAFDFANPDPSYPSLPATTPINCSSGSTPAVPSPQVVPVQEAGTLAPRPLPYQPNALPAASCGAGSFSVLLTNSGAASVHFLVEPNAFRLDNPTPYDVAGSNSAVNVYSTTSTSGNYDLTCYGPNGFQRRFAGNLALDCNQIEAVSYLNPATGELELALANPSSAAVTFTVTNGYATGGLAMYLVAPGATNVITAGSSTNNGFYDLTVTASTDAGFLRRFLGRVETNAALPVTTFASSEGIANYGDNLTFTIHLAGYGVPTGTVQFRTNGVAIGTRVALTAGSATLSTTLLPCGNNLVAAEYSGDLLNPAVTNILLQAVTNEPPTVTLNGASPLTNEAYTVYNDPGATAAANCSSLVTFTTNNPVNPSLPGVYQVTYVATDTAGKSVTNTRTVVVASTVSNLGTNVVALSNGVAFINVQGIPNYQYLLETATNLNGFWWPIATNIANTNGFVNFVDPGATNDQRYYRTTHP